MMNYILISHIVVFITVMPLGIFIHRKLYNNINNEKHRESGKVIQRILKTYSIIQCTLAPLIHLSFTPLLDAELFENMKN